MKECVECGKKTNSCLPSDSGWLCYQCFTGVKPSGSKRKIGHEEDDIQANFFNLVPVMLPKIPDKLLYAVPNGGKRQAFEATRLKKQGVKSGVADVILQIPHNGFGCLCIEFKTATGKQSDEQIAFEKETTAAGNKYVICRTAIEAIEVIKEYLK